MKPIDFAKALVLAAVTLGMLMFLSYPVVAIYAALIAPGHPAAFYKAAATGWLVVWWVRVAGPVVFLFAGWLFTGRVRHRNAYAFIGTMCGWYLLLDLAILTYVGRGVLVLTLDAVIVLAVQFAAAFAGVLLARRTLPANEQPIP